MKANPHPEILTLLAQLGSCFDVASVPEAQAVLAAGATPERISYGNTIKKESEIAAAFKLGITLFAVDCEAEVDKIARAAPGARVICRIHCDGTGAEWPLSRKFGCEPEFAADILERAHKAGLLAHGISFHVGSQQHNVEAWDRALASTAAIFRTCAERGINLSTVNLGGGFPAKYVRKTPKLEILRQGDLPLAAPPFRQPHSGDHHRARPRHGRQCRRDRGRGGADRQAQPGGRHPLGLSRHRQVPRAGRDHRANRSAIRSRPARTATRPAPASWPGPTCDSVDVLYEKTPYPLPVTLAIGDKVLIEAAGAYTSTYSSVGFNGYPPLKSYVIAPSEPALAA